VPESKIPALQPPQDHPTPTRGPGFRRFSVPVQSRIFLHEFDRARSILRIVTVASIILHMDAIRMCPQFRTRDTANNEPAPEFSRNRLPHLALSEQDIGMCLLTFRRSHDLLRLEAHELTRGRKNGCPAGQNGLQLTCARTPAEPGNGERAPFRLEPSRARPEPVKLAGCGHQSLST
jgi:hypothetical protein